MAERHRLFFSLDPDPEVRHEIERLQRRIAGHGRAVRPEQFHLTLAFLGMQQTEVIPKLKNMARSLEFEPCLLELDKIGRFRNGGILWLGPSVAPPELLRFQQALVEGIESLGVDRDRKPWAPHITLYRRLRKPPGIMAPDPVKWRLRGFTLIESVGVRNGVEYRCLGRWNASQ